LEDARFAPEKVEQAALANAAGYVNLVDCRAAASRYLRSIAAEFPAAAGKHLVKAAQVYEQVVGALEEGRRSILFPWRTSATKWSKKQRQAEAEMLTQALALEKKAIAEIEKGLAAMQ